MRSLLRACSGWLTRAQETVPGIVVMAIGGGVVIASVAVMFGRSWEYGARQGAFMMIVIGAGAGWRHYQQHARRLRVWFGVLWVLGAAGLYVTTQSALGEDPVVALMVAAVVGGVGALWVAGDLRAYARARRRDAERATR